MNIIIRAAQFADSAHKGMTRKFTGRPYIEHPLRVAGRVSLVPGADETDVAVAWLHDVIEDCGVEYATLYHEFNHIVAHQVQMLTNPSIGMAANRKARMKINREHFALCNRRVKIIKLVDRIDNLREMPASDFARKYAYESILLADALNSSQPDLLGLPAEVKELARTILESEALCKACAGRGGWYDGDEGQWVSCRECEPAAKG